MGEVENTNKETVLKLKDILRLLRKNYSQARITNICLNADKECIREETGNK